MPQRETLSLVISQQLVWSSNTNLLWRQLPWCRAAPRLDLRETVRRHMNVRYCKEGKAFSSGLLGPYRC